jgi:hypothetical protein
MPLLIRDNSDISIVWEYVRMFGVIGEKESLSPYVSIGIYILCVKDIIKRGHNNYDCLLSDPFGEPSMRE